MSSAATGLQGGREGGGGRGGAGVEIIDYMIYRHTETPVDLRGTGVQKVRIRIGFITKYVYSYEEFALVEMVHLF